MGLFSRLNNFIPKFNYEIDINNKKAKLNIYVISNRNLVMILFYNILNKLGKEYNVDCILDNNLIKIPKKNYKFFIKDINKSIKKINNDLKKDKVQITKYKIKNIEMSKIDNDNFKFNINLSCDAIWL